MIILVRQISDFFLTKGEVLEERARSKIASESVVSAGGIMVANIDSAKDCAASFLDRISDSTEYMMDFQISSLLSGMMRLEAMYPVYF